MTIAHANTNAYEGGSLEGIGKNSLSLKGVNFVTRTAGVVDKSTSETVVDGVNYTVADYAADNQTVDKKTVSYAPASLLREYEVTISGGTVTVADEDKYFKLSDSVTVDGTTGSASTGQLKLVKFISATKGVFTIANV